MGSVSVVVRGGDGGVGGLWRWDACCGRSGVTVGCVCGGGVVRLGVCVGVVYSMVFGGCVVGVGVLLLVVLPGGAGGGEGMV